MNLLQKLVCGLLAAAASGVAPGEAYPAKPIRVIVPFGAGGPADIYARFLAQRLQEPLGQSLVVEARPGAGSIIGTDVVAKAPADGYTLLVMSNTHTVNETLVPMTMSVAEFEKHLNGDIAKWSEIVKLAGARVDR